MTVSFQSLGPQGFQELAAALAIRTFGAGVQAMGSGRDGGRDLYHRGKLVWQPSDGHPGEVWDGYTVFQVKHREKLARQPAEDATWLWTQVKKELDDWADPESGRNPVPDYLLIITNIGLTPVQGAGGHDRLDALIRKYVNDLSDASRDVGSGADRRARLARISRIRKWRFWDANQLNALLKTHEDIRRAFPAFLTAADVFGSLSEFTGVVPIGDLEASLREHARATLIGEALIYFDEAGGSEAAGIPVHRVVTDLPVTTATDIRRTSVIAEVLGRGEQLLKPSLRPGRDSRHLVLTGAPGNGKTTISKFLVQAYRAALLQGTANLSPEHRTTISATQGALERFNRALPRHLRWPMRIDLAEFAQQRGHDDDSTILRWIAEKVSKRSDLGEIRPATLKSWMRHWPWLLVLDGLDEVTAPTVRQSLIRRIVELVTTAEADDCDLFVVLTTRPMGYSEHIAPDQFERIDLDYLSASEAVRYGTLVSKVRLGSDQDRLDTVIRQLNQAVEDESLANLFRTPLQVLIMTIILGDAGQLAPDRYSLFWSYYDTVFRRERSKISDLRKVLQDHRQQIQQLHEAVGFELQIRSEAGDRSLAALSRRELEQLTWAVLQDAGFKPAGSDSDLMAKIINAATKRLVLIAPRGDFGFGFDVRSLQELMAGMHLSTGPMERVEARLRIAAPSPHWRNTWVFAAGRFFARPQEHEHRAIVELVEHVDESDCQRLSAFVPVGPRLALDLIDDGMVRSLPRWRDRLISQALRVLEEPQPADLGNIARALLRFADTGDEQRGSVAQGLRDALSGTPVAQATAKALQSQMAALMGDIGVRLHTRGLVSVRKRSGATSVIPALPVWSEFTDEIATQPGADATLERLRDAAEAITTLHKRGKAEDSQVAAIVTGLFDPPAAEFLVAALRHVAPYEPDLVRLLRDDVIPFVHRAPVGERLRREGQ